MSVRFFRISFVRPILSFVLMSFVLVNVVVAQDYLNDESYTDQGTHVKVTDPLEPFNRAVFTFNDKAFIWVLNPVATGYSKILPGDIRGCVGNFFYNLGEPIRAVNSVLQGRIHDSGLIVSRFFINSLAGVFGLADPASREFKIPRKRATFGQTFSAWGIGDGFYLVVPLLGPSTMRDFSGDVIDAFVTTTYSPWSTDVVTSMAIFGVQEVNFISLHLGVYEDIKSMSFDPYVAFRNAYFQSRDKVSDHVIISNPNFNINK